MEWLPPSVLLLIVVVLSYQWLRRNTRQFNAERLNLHRQAATRSAHENHATANGHARVHSDPSIEDFTQSMLLEYDFPGTDAAVVFVPSGESPPPEVDAVLRNAHCQRLYPIAGGHDVKFPWFLAEGHEHLFRREPQGWNHEHCDFCNATVNIGERCWTADAGGGGVFIFCNACREKVLAG